MRLNLVTEGQSEEAFIRDVLAPHLGEANVFAVARSVQTSRRGTLIYRGGLLDYGRAKRDIERWLSQDHGAVVSTMFDLYALPNDFPGWRTPRTGEDPIARARQIETAMSTDISSTRFIPYVQVHEFEALLFSDVTVIDRLLRESGEPTKEAELTAIRNKFASPEHINDDPRTSPSKRLTAIFPTYQKVVHGSAIGGSIGIGSIKAQCAHFRSWVDTLVAQAAETVR